MEGIEYKGIWSEDGKTLTNVLVGDKEVTYNVVSEWYDGTPMDDSKVDDSLIYVKYDGKFLMKNLNLRGQALIKNTIEELRNMTKEEVLLFKIGYYNSCTVLGYYKKGDKSSVEYIYNKSSVEKDDGGGVIVPQKIGSGVFELKKDTVNYKDFGAGLKGSEYNDAIPIKNAHEYANKNKLPVEQKSGKFFLKEGLGIEIKTSVDWGQTEFEIDEREYKGEWQFIVKGYKEWKDVQLTGEDKTSFLNKFKRVNSGVFTELADYPNHFFKIVNENDRAYRNIAPFTGSYPKQDMFIVEKGGVFVGDIAFELDDYTSLQAIEIEKELTISGGNFTFIGGGSEDEDISGYHKTFMSIERSRTTITDFHIDRPEDSIVSNKPSSGFYVPIDCCYVTIKRGRLVPKKPSGQGSYGLGGNGVFEYRIEDLQVDGDSSYWGVFGTNNIKNLRIKNSILNRIDVHFNAWNIYIDNCIIGTETIRVSGGGDLFITKTDNKGSNTVSSFVIIRNDWASSWDGDIRIINCKHSVISPSFYGAWVQWSNGNFNYNVKQILCRTIEITDSTVNFISNTNDFRMMLFPSRSIVENNTMSPRIIFPKNITFKNISVEGRTKGVLIMDLRYSEQFAPYSGIAEDTFGVESFNTRMEFDNVFTRGQYDVFNITQGFPDDLNVDFVKPEIVFKNLKSQLEITIPKGRAKVKASNCVINRLILGDPDLGKPDPNEPHFADVDVHLEDCIIAPVTRGTTNEFTKKPFYMEYTSSNPFLSNCTIENGRNFSTLFTTYAQWVKATQGLFTPQRYLDSVDSKWYKLSLGGHHNNTKLGETLVQLIADTVTRVGQEFYDELKNSRVNRYNLQIPRTIGFDTERPSFDSTDPITGAGSVNGVPYNGLVYFDRTLKKPLFWYSGLVSGADRGWYDAQGTLVV